MDGAEQAVAACLGLRGHFEQRRWRWWLRAGVQHGGALNAAAADHAEDEDKHGLITHPVLAVSPQVSVAPPGDVWQLVYINKARLT